MHGLGRNKQRGNRETRILNPVQSHTSNETSNHKVVASLHFDICKVGKNVGPLTCDCETCCNEKDLYACLIYGPFWNYSKISELLEVNIPRNISFLTNISNHMPICSWSLSRVSSFLHFSLLVHLVRAFVFFCVLPSVLLQTLSHQTLGQRPGGGSTMSRSKGTK